MPREEHIEVRHIPGAGEWCVRYSANHFYFSTHKNRDEALARARRIAEISLARLVIVEAHGSANCRAHR